MATHGTLLDRILAATASCLMFSAVPSAAHAPLPQATSGIRSSGEVAEAQSLLSRGTPQEAIQLLSHHLQSYPKDTAARLLLAEAYAIAGQNDRALEQYQEVCDLRRTITLRSQRSVKCITGQEILRKPNRFWRACTDIKRPRAL